MRTILASGKNSLKTQRSRVHAFVCIAVAFFLSGCNTNLVQSQTQPLIGSGHGIDHATVLTPSLEQTSAAYSNDLGFTVTPYGQYPDGFENAVIYFQNRTYLELYGMYDRAKVAASEDAYALSSPPGLLWNILHVESTDRTSARLRERKFDVFGPDKFPEADDDSNADAPWYWKLAGLTKPAPGGRLFFIEYNDALLDGFRAKDPEKYTRRETHRNSAQALRAIWVAVQNLDAAVHDYEDLGFVVGGEIEFPKLSAVGRQVSAGNGTILLLQATNPDSEVASFLGNRTDAYMGISIKVSDLKIARTFIESATGDALSEYEGIYGRSILVPASRAHGVWIEFF